MQVKNYVNTSFLVMVLKKLPDVAEPVMTAGNCHQKIPQ